MRQAILVNGVPASGKSTVAKQVVQALLDRGICTVPLGIDTVKEGLFAQLGTGDREYNRMLGRASYHAIFDTIATFPETLVPVIDAWHGFQPESVLRGHIARARVDRVIEIWCAVAPETAAERYRDRAANRHAGHLPSSYADELFELAGRATPIALDKVVWVAEEQPVDSKFFNTLHDLLTAEFIDTESEHRA